MGLEEIRRSLAVLNDKIQAYEKESDKKKRDEIRKGMLEISSTIRKLVRGQAEQVKDV